MTPRSAAGRAWFSTIAFVCVIALVVAVGLAFAMNRPANTRYSAMLSTVIGLYPGSDVRVLGVPVGRVDSVQPIGQLVRVNFHVGADTLVPAGVMAAVVAPTVVSDRYLQLAPVYTGGPTLAAGSVIPRARTASPAEFDDLLASVQRLSKSLGPQGVNNTGALSDALSTLARNLDGNGQRANTTLDKLSQAVTTLSDSRNNLSGTVTNLQSFTSNLKQNDNKVRAFTQQLAQVSGYLSDERQNLGETLRLLSKTLGDVADFVHDNRSRLHSNVDRLSEVLKTVNGERLSLEQGLDVAPLGLDGLVNGYNASSGTLDTRAALLQTLVCTIYGLPLPAPLKAVLTQALDVLFAPNGVVNGCAGTTGSNVVKLPALPANALSKLTLPAAVRPSGSGR